MGAGVWPWCATVHGIANGQVTEVTEQQKLSPKATGDKKKKKKPHYQAKYFKGLELIPQESDEVCGKDSPVEILQDLNKPGLLNYIFPTHKYSSTNNFQGKIKNLKRNWNIKNNLKANQPTSTCMFYLKYFRNK